MSGILKLSENRSNESSDVGVVKISDFLEFLNISFQVTDSINNKNQSKNSNQLDFDQLQNNELITSLLTRANNAVRSSSPPNVFTGKGKSEDEKDEKKLKNKKGVTKSRSKFSSNGERGLDTALQAKLDEVINEGILDSVLPFVCGSANQECNGHATVTANQNGAKSKNLSPSVKAINGANNEKPQDLPIEGAAVGKKPQSTPDKQISVSHPPKTMRKKSSVGNSLGHNEKNGEPEVIIRVCDELKGVSRDFSCPQKLLVSKMGYFADVTAGQRLEDMDISVHCDLQIFEWLMKWVKRDNFPPEEWPSLDASNVVPILVSASFLQMEPLLLDCLSFCHGKLNDVIKASANLSCLNDNIITRLAAMFTNVELESVKDKKDRIAPRIWTKMIQSLCEIEPQALRGHYASLAGLYRCSRCGKYLTQTVASFVFCVPQNMKLNRWGQLVSAHVRDTQWNLTNYVSALHKELKSWRKVYWRLWGHCHFLYCSICEQYFPTYQMLWCQFHPELPQFIGPATGRYPCCGSQANRYETLPGPSGCQFREHTIIPETDRDRAIIQLCMVAADGGNLYEQPPIKPYVAGQNENWWAGISLIPRGARQGLLPPLYIEDVTRSRKFIARQASTSCVESSSDTESSEYDKTFSNLSHSSSDSSDGEESEDLSSSSVTFNKGKKQENRKRGKPAMAKQSHGRVAWSGETSARSNQDNQREFEERAMKQVITLVGKKTGSDTNTYMQMYQQGGIYVKLESDWRENYRQKHTSSRMRSMTLK
ncbi:SANT and BTB domain regulator of class switch recombination [Culicoides brevitarsis]|uniref:SANT and BTB domain regulator of class switch recombination n=1 Tax=Culicoides brevitarsis TaxID=469753 RepID=UPI00307B5D93